MKNRFMLKLIGLLIAIIALIVASSVIAFAEDIPFFCDTAISARQRIDREELLSCYFYQQDYIYIEQMQKQLTFIHRPKEQHVFMMMVMKRCLRQIPDIILQI